MDTLDESWVERKLLTASNTQESVQSLSMWALHHKTQHERIVSIWFKVLKAAKIDLRLTLFYLCNEVVQTCRRRHAVVYKDAFKEVLRDAALLVRDISIRPNIERIFKIWAERGVYDAEFVNELLLLLNNTKVKNAMNTKLLADFSPRKLMDQLSVCSQLEEAVEEQREQLANIDVEALDGESFKQQLKDRHQGVEYADELAAACQQIQSYINNLETETRERITLIELLEQSQLYYDAQSSEANMVAMAYKTFAGRIAVVHKKLSEMRKGTQHPSQDIDLEELSGGGKRDSAELNDGLRPYQADTRHSSDDEHPEGFLDDNSPLPYITPMDYFDEPINDEDIFCTTSSSSKLFHSDTNFAGGGGSSNTSAAVLSDKRQSSVDSTYRLSSNEPGHRSRHTSTEHELRRSPKTSPSSHHRKSTDDLDQSSRNRSRLDVDRDMMDLSDKIASFESTHRMLLLDDDADPDPLYDAALHHSFDKDASYHSNADTPHRRSAKESGSGGGGKQSSSSRRVSSESETSSHIRRRSASRGSVSPKLNSSFPPDSPKEQAHRSNCSSKFASGSTGTGLYPAGQSGVSFLPTPHGVTSSSGASTVFSANSGLSFIDTSVPPPPPPLTTTPGVDMFPDTSVPPPPLPAIFQHLLPSTNAAVYPPPGGVLSSLQPAATPQHVVQQHPLSATVQYIDPAATIHQASSRGHEQAFSATTLYHSASVLVSDAAYPSDGLPSTGYSNEEGSGTPTRDEEGSSTPVLDEPEEDDFKYTFRLDASNSVRNPPPPPQQQQQQQMLLGPSSRTVVESNHHQQQQDRQRQQSAERQRKRNHSFSSDERPHHASWDERRELSSSSSIKRERERERSLSSYSDDSIDDRRPLYKDKRVSGAGGGSGHRDRSRDRDRRSSRDSEDRDLYHRTSLEPLSSNSRGGGGTSSVIMIATDVDAHHHHQLQQQQQQHIYHHPPPHMPVAVHSQDVASVPLTYSTNVAPVASASTPDVIYGQQPPQSNSVVELNSVTYLPVGSNGHNATTATVYQPHPVADFSVPPPTAAAAAVFNPSVPPPNLSLPPPSLAPVQQHAQTPHLLAAGAAEQLHHVSYQFPPSQQPPPRIVQITVLPQAAPLVEQSPVPTMTMFGATAAPPQSPLHGGTGGHMLGGPPPPARQMLAAPPRRIEYNQQPSAATQRQLGEFEASSSGRRRPYSNITVKPCGDNDAVSSSSSAAAGTSPDILESKRRMIAISPSNESPPRRQSSAGDTVLDAGGSSDGTLTTTVDSGGGASQQQQQIPTVVLSSDRNHRQQRHDGTTTARYGRPGMIHSSAGQRRNWL